MTISTTSNQALLLGNGATNPFIYSFVCDSASNFQAILNNADGTQTLLLPAQYTLFRNPPAVGSLHSIGGTITYPTVGPPIPAGTSLLVRDILPLTQPTSISNQGDFYPTVTEAALDNLTLQVQQINSRTGQTRGTWQTGITYGYGDVVQDGVNGTNTGNYYMNVIPGVSGVWATDLAAGVWSAVIDTQQIAAYAAAAAASAVAAATSASTATTQAGIATTQAGIATTQAGISTANAALTAADVITTNANVALTAADVITTGANVALTAADVVSTNADVVTTNANVVSSAASAAAAAASAVLAGSALSSTSTTSLLIATGSKVFTTQASKNYFPGQFLIAASNANETNYMHGQVTGYSGTTLTINVTDIGGAGTFADWNISVSGTGPVVANINGGSP